MTFRRYRMVPSTPRSLVKFAARLSSVSTGCVEFDADQTPGAAGDVGEVRVLGRHADDRGRGVVGADGGHGQRPVQPELRSRPPG